MTTAPDHENPAVADIRAREAADRRVSLSNKECCDEGGWRPSSQRVKVQNRVLHRYLDGSSVRITARSFYQHLIDLAARRRAGPQALDDKLSEAITPTHRGRA